MDSNTISVQIGTNGYNYSPITPLFVPYVQVYAYMEELAEVNSAINPAAMVEFMFNEICHVTDDSSRDVALYYIGDNWDSVDDEYDTVPDIENYTYDEDAIIEAINIGIEYAMSDEAEANDNTLLAAYRTSENAYIILTEYLTTSKNGAEGDEYIELVDTGNALDGGENVIYYLNTTALYNAAVDSTEGDMGSNESGTVSEYENVDSSYAQIIDYYNSGEYGYGDDLQATLQNYLSHMVEHVWDPSDLLSVEGTYGYTGATSAAEFLFTDVSESDYYYNAVVWASETGVTSGTSDTTFSPSQDCNRAQFVTFLYALANATGVDTSVASTSTAFTDVTEIDLYYNAVVWARETGLTAGTSDTTFTPSKAITRREAITMLYAYEKMVNGVSTADITNPFSDVNTDDYAYNAILWAYEQGITAGTTETTFGPAQTCTRAMMITFLYAYNNLA